jgi:hypothetical protein
MFLLWADFMPVARQYVHLLGYGAQVVPVEAGPDALFGHCAEEVATTPVA